MLAQAVSPVDLQAFTTESIVTLLLIAGLSLVVSFILFGQNQVSSDPSLHQIRTQRRKERHQTGEIPPPGPKRELGKRRDKRSALRRKGEPVKVLVTGAAPEPLPGLVVDRSRGGLGLVLHQQVPTGTVLGVRAGAAPEDLPWVQVMVRHCRAHGDSWKVGCQFVEKLPWSVVLLFG